MSNNRPKKIYDLQEARQKKFPKDRIAFHRSSATAIEDSASLAKYANGYLSFEKLCYEIAYHNYLERYFPDGKIPRDMMINELKILGEWIYG